MPRVDGIDVSQWNGVIDWACVKAHTPGAWSAAQVLDRNNANREDPKYRANRAGMQSAGFSHRLLYYFPVLDNSISIPAQADQFAAAIGSFAVGEGPMLDAENDSKRGPITEEFAYQWIVECERRLQRPVAVYTGLYVDSGRIWNSTRIFNGTRARILAYYSTSQETVYNAARPYKPDAWQWTGSGSFCGTSPLDLDQVDNLFAFDQCCGYGSMPLDEEVQPHLASMYVGVR